MTRTQKLENFMEAVTLQQTMDTLRSKRKTLRNKYLSSDVHEGSKVLKDWTRINELIDQVNSDLFYILNQA